MSLNLHRRHLTSGQRAACGTEVEERLAVEAKERQRISGGDKKSSIAKESRSVKEIVPQPIRHIPQARDEAAILVRSNPRYIQDAKAIKAASPELHEKVKAGTITLPQAKREIQWQEKRETLTAKAAAVAAVATVGNSLDFGGFVADHPQLCPKSISSPPDPPQDSPSCPGGPDSLGLRVRSRDRPTPDRVIGNYL